MKKYGNEAISVYEAVQAVLLSSREAWSLKDLMSLFTCSHEELALRVPNEYARHAVHCARAEKGDKASDVISDSLLCNAFDAKVHVLIGILNQDRLEGDLEEWRQMALQVAESDAGTG